MYREDFSRSTAVSDHRLSDRSARIPSNTENRLENNEANNDDHQYVEIKFDFPVHS